MTPNTQAARAPEEEEDLTWLRESIGHITAVQEPIIRQALTENAAGVHALAAKIASDENVRSPIAVLIYGIKEGKHTTQPRKPRAKTPSTPPLERAHALFTGKMRDLEGVPWSEHERIEYAIDYALDHAGAYGQTLLNLEQQLRAELHSPRWNGQGQTPRDPAKYTEHREAMRQAHRAIEEPETLDDDDHIPY